MIMIAMMIMNIANDDDNGDADDGDKERIDHGGDDYPAHNGYANDDGDKDEIYD